MDVFKQIVKCPSSDLQHLEWEDGSTYKGNCVTNTKVGYGEFTWANGEKYTGEFYKDHHHGKGIYTWPDGSKFTGTFYLNRREGYGTLETNGKINFQGLYEADERFGPGIETYENGTKDVGFWFGDHLIKLCTKIPGSFSLQDYPEYHQYLEDNAEMMPLDDDITASTTDEADPFMYNYKELLLNDSYTLPENIYVYTSNVEHLPFTTSLRKEFDAHFFHEHEKLEEAEDVQCVIKNRTPLMARMQKHIHTHRYSQAGVDWDVNSILNGHREKFGPKGPKEFISERLIRKAAEGDYDKVYKILRDNLAHPDVADANGYTALLAAAANCHCDIINLLLDNGANVNKLNDEGLTALSVCLMRYYPSASFHSNIAERNISEVKYNEESALKAKKIQMDAISHDDIIKREQLFFQDTDLHSDMVHSASPRNLKINIDLSILGPEVPKSPAEEKLTPKSDIDNVSYDVKSGFSFITDSFGSDRSIFDFDVKFSKDVLKKSTDLFSPLSTTYRPSAVSTDEETVRKMAQLKAEQKEIWSTIKLLLRRGADPNISNMPMHPLFFAVKTGDVEAVKLLLEKGAASALRSPSQDRGLTPLHIAAALPGIEGIKITEMLLHAAMDPNARAEDEEPEASFGTEETPNVISGFPMKGCNATGEVLYDYFEKSAIVPEEGGRSPLHIACERTDNPEHARDIVHLLLMHKADPNVLWHGHSPLSLAIANGNDLAVKELLKNGADPNLQLGRGIESALCSAVNPDFQQNRNLQARISMIDMLVEAGANVLMPISLGQGTKAVLGTATDYAYYKHYQDKKLSQTHILSPVERENLNSRKQILEYMGDLTRKTVTKIEKEWLEDKLARDIQRADLSKDEAAKAEETALDMDKKCRTPNFKYCYGCGRSVGVHLSPCAHCKGVYTCSSYCKKKAWNEYHKNECATLKELLQGTKKQDSKRQTEESSKDNLHRKLMQKGIMESAETRGSSTESQRTKMMQKGILADDSDESSMGYRSAKLLQKGIKAKGSGEGSDKEIQSQKQMLLKRIMAKEDDEGTSKDSHTKKMLLKGIMAKGEIEGTSKESYSKKMALKEITTKGDLGIQESPSKRTLKGIMGKEEGEEGSKDIQGKKIRSKKDEGQGSSRESYSARMALKGFMSKGEEGTMDSHSKKMTMKGLGSKEETDGSSLGLYSKKIIPKGILSKRDAERFHMESQNGKSTLHGIMRRPVSHIKKMLKEGFIAKGEIEGRNIDFMIDNYSFI